MRLSQEHAQAIAKCTREAFGEKAVVRLFGSRADDSKKGGDIDLHLEVPDRPDWFEAKSAFQYGLYRALGDRKIDIVIHREGQPLLPIDRIALNQGVIL
jgi:predicted nucleotidyltransferase